MSINNSGVEDPTQYKIDMTINYSGVEDHPRKIQIQFQKYHMLPSICHSSVHVSANISIHLSFSVLRSCRIYGFHIHIMIVHRYLYYQGFRHLKKPCYEQSVHASYKYLRVNPCMHVCSPNCMHMRNILYRPCVVV